MATKSRAKKTAKKKPSAKAPATRKRIVKKLPSDKTADRSQMENDWSGLFVLAEHWQSDLKFYADESQFFRSLIDKYFMWLIDEKYINDTRKMAVRLKEFENRRVQLENNVTEHLRHLTNLIQNPFAYDAQGFRDEHARLGDAMAILLKDFRMIKKEVFLLTEQVIESEKIQHLLGR